MITVVLCLLIFLVGCLDYQAYDIKEEQQQEDPSDADLLKEIEAIDDIGFYVQGELVTAAGVKDGYNRTFNIPDKSDTISYIISITNYTKLIVTSQDYEALFYIPNVNGTILIGNNTIRKTNGTVFLNE